MQGGNTIMVPGPFCTAEQIASVLSRDGDGRKPGASLHVLPTSPEET